MFFEFLPRLTVFSITETNSSSWNESDMHWQNEHTFPRCSPPPQRLWMGFQSDCSLSRYHDAAVSNPQRVSRKCAEELRWRGQNESWYSTSGRFATSFCWWAFTTNRQMVVGLDASRRLTGSTNPNVKSFSRKCAVTSEGSSTSWELMSYKNTSGLTGILLGCCSRISRTSSTRCSVRKKTKNKKGSEHFHHERGCSASNESSEFKLSGRFPDVKLKKEIPVCWNLKSRFLTGVSPGSSRKLFIRRRGVNISAASRSAALTWIWKRVPFPSIIYEAEL